MTSVVEAWAQVLEELHQEIFKVVEPLTDEQINWVHPHLSNTVGILLRHVAGSERYWISEIVGGRSAHRERASEFVREPLQKVPLLEGLRQAYASVREVLDDLTEAELHQEVELPGGSQPRRVTKKWALLHSLTHTAYHLGQLQLYRKMATSDRRVRNDLHA